MPRATALIEDEPDSTCTTKSSSGTGGILGKGEATVQGLGQKCRRAAYALTTATCTTEWPTQLAAPAVLVSMPDVNKIVVRTMTLMEDDRWRGGSVAA